MSRLSEVANSASAEPRMTRSNSAWFDVTAGATAIAAKAASPTTISKRCERLLMSGDGLAEQAGRLYDQDDDHEQVHQTIGEQREPEAAEAADQPDENRSDERTENRAHSADHCDNEGFDEYGESHPGCQRAHRRRECPGKAREQPAEREHQAIEQLGIDAERGNHAGINGSRAN